MQDQPPVAAADLAAENQALREKLEAAEEMLRAIRSDEVDALVVDQNGTERVRTLTGADEAYRAFVEVMCQGAATVATDGRILYCNKHFAELLRSPLEQTIGTSIFDFAEAADEGALRAMLWEGINTSCVGKPFPMRTRDGNALSTVVTATPVSMDNSSCVCLVLTDLTDREARVAAEAASRAKDRFLAALSHELRTPLTPVVMTLASLEVDNRLPADVRDELEMVRRNVELETRLIDDLLDLSRVITGKLRLRVEPVRVHGLVSNVLEMVASDLNRKSIKLNCEWSASIDRVNGDPTRLQQLIWNILKNAVKFGKDNGRIELRSNNPDENTLELQIRDDGAGIDPELLPTIFNAFEQGVVDRGRRESSGLGLGLTIAKAVVEMHGGAIHAESGGPGEGALIRITLPVTSIEAPDATPRKPSEDSESDDGSFRVLLVEDHAETARILAKLLRRSGHTVKTAGTVAEAIHLATSDVFDIVISDIGLPDGTGHDLMLQIKQQHNIPGVALTGYGMEDDLARSREVGFAEHVVKPVNLQHLESVISRVVRGRPTVS